MKATLLGSALFFYVFWLCLQQYVWLASLLPGSWFILFCVAVTTASSAFMGAILLIYAFRVKEERREAEEHSEYVKRITIMPTKVE